MRLLALGFLGFVVGCGFEPFDGETTARPVRVLPAPACDGLDCTRTSAATVENGLPYDGCSYPLTIDGVQYAPSADSQARVGAVAQVGRVNVSVTWRATGNQTTVACGWGSSQTLPEVQVVSIAPRAAP